MANKLLTDECKWGEHHNCDGVAWSADGNHPVACDCTDCDCAPSLFDQEYIRQYVEEPDVLYIKPPDGGDPSVGLVDK